jgi:hypothetical protein
MKLPKEYERELLSRPDTIIHPSGGVALEDAVRAQFGGTTRGTEKGEAKVPAKHREKRANRTAESHEKPGENERLFNAICEANGLPVPIHEFPWHPERKFRFDWLFEGWLAVERVGGVWIKGHHSRGQSQIDDMARRNEAQIMGYVVLEFPPEQFKTGEAFAVIKRALGS